LTDQLIRSDGRNPSEGALLFPRGARPDDLGIEALQKAARKVVAAFAQIGALASMVLDATYATGEAVVCRRLSWPEFFEQTWFLISVTFLPTLMISIPFGLVIVLEVGGRAVALVFLNQTVTNTTQRKGQPTTTQSRVEVTLVHQHGRWLIDQVSLL
jgi:hypothetical protein